MKVQPFPIHLLLLTVSETAVLNKTPVLFFRCLLIDMSWQEQAVANFERHERCISNVKSPSVYPSI